MSADLIQRLRAASGGYDGLERDAATELERLTAELAAARVDAERLDWLDAVNARTNKHYKTTYGWRFNLNHNRAALTDHNIPALSVRAAIDAARQAG